MRQIVIIILLILTKSIHGQAQLDSMLSNPDYYVYNNSKDTLFLTKMNAHKSELFWKKPLKSTKIYDTIQIDGIGSNEIVFERIYSGTSELYMQAFSSKDTTKIRKFEIWNIDTKTLLYEAISEYEFIYEYWQLKNLDSLNDVNGWCKGQCSYRYTFSIDKAGLIHIAQIKYNNKNDACVADKKEGLYIYSDGKYINIQK